MNTSLTQNIRNQICNNPFYTIYESYWTGYMFRNAEYVLALKELMKLKGRKLTIDDYKDAFDRLDSDNSGYIERSEIQELFKEAYGGNEDDVPALEIKAFLDFFDTNEDGKISWQEF
jgi:Ca2+-binding EF-hand superfamily protein